MIHITLAEENGNCQLKCEGHADYAEKGKDIVCAAVSAIMQSFIFEMRELRDRNKIKICMITDMDGFEDIIFGNISTEATVCLEMVWNGLSAIADEYPEWVSLTTSEKIT